MKNLIKVFLLGTIIISHYSCSESNTTEEQAIEEVEVTPESLKLSIKEIDDSLLILYKRRMKEDNFKIDRLVYHEAINRNKAFYENYPEHEYAPRAVEKIASMYLQLNIEEEAVKWRDTILYNYPDFERKLDILELQKSYYDNFDAYDPEKIKFYSNEMLKTKGISEEKKEDIKFRLKHIDLNFKELVELRMAEAEKEEQS